MKRTVSDEAAEVSADYAVPGRTFSLIELWGVVRFISNMRAWRWQGYLRSS